MGIISIIKDILITIWNTKEWTFSGIGNVIVSCLGRGIEKGVSSLINKTNKKGLLYCNNDLVHMLKIKETIKEYFPQYNDLLLIQHRY